MPDDSHVRTARLADPTRLGWRRRQMALIVTLIGLLTFVSPLVETDSEILGRTRWSPLQVIAALHAGTLPVAHRMSRVNSVELSIDFLFGVGVAYLILILIATAILFFPSARFVVSAAAIGAATVWEETRFRYQDLQDAIYGEPSAFAGHQVHAGTNSLFLLGVLGLLFWIAATKALD